MDIIPELDRQVTKVDQNPINGNNSYSFRLLDKDEATNNPNIVRNSKQLELTRRLLTNPELRPTGVLQIDDKEFLVGKVLKGGTKC